MPARPAEDRQSAAAAPLAAAAETTRSCPNCGCTRAYATPAIAAARHPQHSCAHHDRRRTAAQRPAERDRTATTQPCQHPHAAHQHGTRACYVRDRCRCRDCTAANTAASRARYRDRAYGRTAHTDAGPVRAHLHALRVCGLGLERIAQLSGVSAHRLRDLLRPGAPQARVRTATADRVLAVPADSRRRAPGSRVDSTGTRRRLHALHRLGWSTHQLASALGRSPSNLARTRRSSQVAAATAFQIAALYERLSPHGPPERTPQQHRAAERARAQATAHGWPAPLAWDDIDHDPDPPQTPLAATTPADDLDEIVLERVLRGDRIALSALTPAEQNEAVRRLTARGCSVPAIAEQLHTTTRTVSRRRTAGRATTPSPPSAATHAA